MKYTSHGFDGIFRGEANVIEEYKIGPLPNPTTHAKLRFPKWRSPIPYRTRTPSSEMEGPHIFTFLTKALVPVDDILQEFTGYTWNPATCGKRCLTYYPSVPASFDPSERKMFVFVLRKVEGYYLHPIGLQIKIDILALNASDWTVDYVWFRGQEFRSLAELRRAHTDQRLATKGMPPPTLYDKIDPKQMFSTLNFRGDPLPKKPQRGPRTYMPDGRRYTVKGHHIDWQGWSFDFNMRSVTGIQVHDIRFHGDRVVYELALSELGVLYSGSSPVALYTAYVDTIVQLGRESYELFPGIDCPEYADFFDFAHYLHFKPFLYKNSACIFEMDKGIPLRRHYETNHMGGYEWVQGMPDNVLILRSMVVAYNYEYIVDVVFHQDGSLEVVSTLSGYIIATYTSHIMNNKHGFEVFPNGIGNMHNHLINFKVDMDIEGTSNRFESLDVKLEQVDSPANPNEKLYARYFERNLRQTEMDGTYSYNFNTPKYLLFYNNETEKNPYGNPKSYRLIPVDMSKLLLPQDWQIDKAYQWARYQV